MSDYSVPKLVRILNNGSAIQVQQFRVHETKVQKTNPTAELSRAIATSCLVRQLYEFSIPQATTHRAARGQLQRVSIRRRSQAGSQIRRSERSSHAYFSAAKVSERGRGLSQNTALSKWTQPPKVDANLKSGCILVVHYGRYLQRCLKLGEKIRVMQALN